MGSLRKEFTLILLLYVLHAHSKSVWDAPKRNETDKSSTLHIENNHACDCDSTQECYIDNQGLPKCRCPVGKVEIEKEGVATCLIKCEFDNQCEMKEQCLKLSKENQKACVACNCEETQECFINDQGLQMCRCPHEQYEMVKDGVATCLSICEDDYGCFNSEKCIKPAKGDQKVCVERKCYNNPCEDGGTCTESEDEDTFKCNCRSDRKGTTCQFKRECQSDTCGPRGACTESEDEQGFKCFCHVDRRGSTCQYEKACKSNPCQHGTCNENVDDAGYTCTCENGWKSVNCEIEQACKSNPCQHGTCNENEEGYTCICENGWTGQNCEIEQVCEPNPCQHGSCKENIDAEGYNCTCENGWEGVNCDKIIDCNCGLFGMCVLGSGKKLCYCNDGFSEEDGICKECDCGPFGRCSLENGLKKCLCINGYALKDGICAECRCGSREDCTFVSGRKKCHCKNNTVEKDGICAYCYCGENSTSCHFDWKGVRRCNCSSGYAEYQGSCDECNCGDNSLSCRFDKRGIKNCQCTSGYAENHGICEECKCGIYGTCGFKQGQKQCNCSSFAVEKNGMCVVRETTLSEDFSTVATTTNMPSTSQGCSCGVNSFSCLFRRDGTKECGCYFGYNQVNGYCSAICSEDKCAHGKCEVKKDSFKCSCYEGFTGERCDEKIKTKSDKQDLWKILEVSGIFAIFVLMTVILCTMTRILRKISNK